MQRSKGYPLFFQILAGALLFSFSQILMADFQHELFNAQKRLANLGDAKAQYKLGVMYESGRGVDRNLDKAIEWMKKSSEQGYGLAKLRMRYTRILKSGTDKERDKNWIKQVQKLTDQGNGYGLLLSGLMYKNGIYVGKDLKKAAKLFSQANSKGMVEANTELYELEKLLPKETKPEPKPEPKPVEVKKPAKPVVVAKKEKQEPSPKDARDQYKLGVMYENGRGIHRDLDKAIKWMEKSAEQGYGLAKLRVRYTRILKSGTDPQRDINWFNTINRLADQGNGYGLLLSGLLYKNGIYVDKDLNKAAKLFQQADSKGMDEASIELHDIQNGH